MKITEFIAQANSYIEDVNKELLKPLGLGIATEFSKVKSINDLTIIAAIFHVDANSKPIGREVTKIKAHTTTELRQWINDTARKFTKE